MAGSRQLRKFCEKCGKYVEVLFTSTSTGNNTKTVHERCAVCYTEIEQIPNVQCSGD